MNNFDRAEKACYDRLKRAKKDTKTAREIELEKKLEIAKNALVKYANALNWDDCLVDGKIKVNAFLETAGYKYAEQALKEIK